MVTVLELAVDTDHLPRYNMRRAASRPPPAARPRVLAKPQTESTLVQTTPSSAASLLLVDTRGARACSPKSGLAHPWLALPPQPSRQGLNPPLRPAAGREKKEKRLA